MEQVSAFLHSLARSRIALPILVVLGFVFSIAAERWPIINGYTYLVLVTIGINIILCASLNLVNGYMGEFSVGHAGFMSLGAYAAGMLSTRALPVLLAGVPEDWKWFGISFSFFLSILCGGLLAAVIGFLLALLSFKTRGDYLAIITLAFLMIVKSAFENMPYVGGPRGLSGIPKLTTLPWTFFWMVATLWMIRNMVYSKFGRAIIAIREDEIAANAMGVRTREAKILAFSVSSFFGGVGGALTAHQLQFINPSYFDILKSTEILVMVYLGGIGSLSGSILGATIYTILREWLQPLGTWRMVIMSLLLVLLMLFRPRGIMGLRELAWFLPKRELGTRPPI